MNVDERAQAAAALIEKNRRRRSIRRWIAIATLPLTIAALLLTGKVLSMYAFAHQSITAYTSGDDAGTIRAAQGQEFANLFEQYKAPFNVGVGLAASQQLPEARTKFEEALPLARGLEVCGVRVNLALVIEQMGDAARTGGDGATAAELYAEALVVTLETPKECGSTESREQSSDPDRDMQDSIEQLEQRLQQKQQQPAPEEQPPPQEEPQPSEDDLDELEDRLDQGRSDREEQQQGEGDAQGSGTDRPW